MNDDKISNMFSDWIRDKSNEYADWWEYGHNPAERWYAEACYIAGYKAASAELDYLKRQLDGFKDQYNINSKLSAELDQLREENERLRCCGNCGIYFECTNTDQISDAGCPSWQPKGEEQ